MAPPPSLDAHGAAALRRRAEDYLASAARGRDVFVYFNNDLGGHAVRDALDLLALLGKERPAPSATP